MKTKRTTVVEADLKRTEVVGMLIDAAQEVVNADGKLGSLTGATAKDGDDFSAHVTLTFEVSAEVKS